MIQTGVLLAACFLLSTDLFARDYAPLLSERSMESPFVAVADRLLPAVVFIETSEKVDLSRMHRNMPDDSFHDGITEVSSSGSGLIVSAEGHVLTNYHVVEDADRIQVRLDDGRELAASVVGVDSETDLAVLLVNQRFGEERVAPLGKSESMRIGDWAIALGSPLGLQQSLTVGVISAMGRSDLSIYGGAPVFQDFLQTDASINFGNSGGPLANIRGEVIGINTAINSMGQGIGFAIPIDMARSVYDQILQYGRVRRGYLGMSPGALDPPDRRRLGLPENAEGILVLSVEQGTPAGRGDLRVEDVITRFNGNTVRTVQDFRMRVAEVSPGELVQATVLRRGEARELSFRLEDRADHVPIAQAPRPQLPGPGEGFADESSRILGMDVRVAGRETLRRMGVESEVDGGVLIVDIRRDSWVYGELQADDLITKVDRYRIRSLSDLRRAREAIRQRQGATLFHVIRGERSIIVPVLPD